MPQGNATTGRKKGTRRQPRLGRAGEELRKVLRKETGGDHLVNMLDASAQFFERIEGSENLTPLLNALMKAERALAEISGSLRDSLTLSLDSDEKEFPPPSVESARDMLRRLREAVEHRRTRLGLMSAMTPRKQMRLEIVEFFELHLKGAVLKDAFDLASLDYFGFEAQDSDRVLRRTRAELKRMR